MRRRDFIAGLAGATAWPLAARAQQTAMTTRLGVLLYSTPQAESQTERVLIGLRELGYIEGRNLVVSYHYAEGKPERLPDLAAALVRESPDLLLALGGDVAPHAAKATSTIPIVFVSSADPVQLGLAASLARPAGNATGVTLLQDDLASKRLELLKEAVPHVSRVAFLWNPDHPDNELREAQRAAQSLDVRLHLAEMRSSGDLESVFRAVTQADCDGLYVVSSRHTALNTRKNRGLCVERSHSVGGRLGSLGARRGTPLLRTERRRYVSPRHRLYRQDTEGRQASRPSGSTANEV
jgi:putative tryptophan/tyrosine transport system substrate-binding protein